MTAPTFSNLTSGSTGTDGTSVTTASVSPTGNRLVLLSVHVKRNTTAQPPQPTISGGGMTAWTLVEDCIVDGSGSDRANCWIFRAMQSSPGSGTITIDFGAVTVHDFAWSVDQSDANVDTSGTNGSGAIGNTAFFNDDGAGTSVSVNITINSGNGGFSAAGCQGNPPSWTVRSGWNELAQPGQGSCRLLTQYENATDTAISATHASSRSGIVGAEIKAAASGAPLEVASETNQAQAFTGSKTGTFPTPTGTDVAQAFSGAKVGSLVLAEETDQAVAFSGTKAGTVEIASETDQAIAFSGVKSGVLGIAIEENVALNLLTGASGNLEAATETDQAIPFTGEKSGVLGVAIDTSEAIPFGGVKIGVIQIAVVTDVAIAFSEAGSGMAILPATLLEGSIADIERNFYLVNLSLSEPNDEDVITLERKFYLNQLSLSDSPLSTVDLERAFYELYLIVSSDPEIETARLARMFFLARLGLGSSDESNADLEYRAYYETN